MALYYPSRDDYVPFVSDDHSFQETCRQRIEVLGASKVFIICSGSLAKDTWCLQDLENALDGKIAKIRIGMKPHTLMSEVMEIIGDATRADVDLIITLGGGKLIDAAKAVALALGNDVITEFDLMALSQTFNRNVPARPPKCPIFCILTTLSGSEHIPYAGVTRESDLKKFILYNPRTPELVIMEINLVLTTPQNIWIQSAVPALDYCVESYCSTSANDEVLEVYVKALQCLILALLICKADPSNAKAREECLLSLPMAMPLPHMQMGFHLGASHGIGRQLGPLGVGHGETSCILLPAVCKWNAKQNPLVAERQASLREALWDIYAVRRIFEAWGLGENEGTADLGDLIDALVRELGMPRRLEEVGIGRDRFQALAINALDDECTQTNPVRIDRVDQILEILDMCA